jgi:hypothetical protein
MKALAVLLERIKKTKEKGKYNKKEERDHAKT